MRRTTAILVALTILTTGCLQSTGPAQRTTSDPNQERLHRLLVDPSIHTIVVDIDYIDGREIRDITIQGIIKNLEVVVPQKEIIINGPTLISEARDSSDSKEWNLEDLGELIKRNKFDVGPGQAIIHILSVNGYRISDGGKPSGSYIEKYDASIYFPDVSDTGIARISDFEAPHPGAPEMERAIIIHEMGHALGLVDRGVPMLTNRTPSPGEDPCQCHSTQEDSPMYFRLNQTGWLLEKVEANEHIPYLFNEDDLADLRSFQAQGSRHGAR